MFKIRKYLTDHYILKTKVPKERLWLKVLFFGISGAGVGVMAGLSSADSEDKSKYCVNFNGQEEQLFEILDQTQKPIIRFYYCSGQPMLFKQRPGFLQAAKKYHNEAHFMMINCSKNYQHCRNFDITRMPFVNVTLPENSKLVENVDEYRKDGVYPMIESFYDFTFEGIEAILRKLHIIKPLDFTDASMKKINNMMKVK